MADLSIIRIDQVVPGTTVRVVLSSQANSKLFSDRSRHRGLFRVLPSGQVDLLQKRDWRRLVGLSRRKFTARVLENDSARKDITFQIEDSQASNDSQIRYRVVLPYNQIIRLSRLVFQGREFDSIEAEQKFRRQFRASAVDKAYFDPKDRFVAVSLLF